MIHELVASYVAYIKVLYTMNGLFISRSGHNKERSDYLIFLLEDGRGL